MGNLSSAHWLIIIVWLALVIWYIASTVRLLRAAHMAGLWAILVLIPGIGAPIVQGILANRLGSR
jgi:uncharacterized membrane protein YhaH (DUF805 family)